MRDAQLAQIYSVAVSTISRWRRAGVVQSNPAPIHAPDKMEKWWEEMVAVGEFDKSVPATVLAAAARYKAALPPGGGVGADDAAPTGTDPGMERLLASIEAGQTFDYSDGIAVAQRGVQVCDFLLLRALKAGDEAKIGALAKRLNEAQDSLRTLLKDRGKIQADAGEVIARHEVRSAMVDLHGTITKRFRLSLRNAYSDFGDTPLTRETWNLKVDQTVDQVCAGLLADKFSPGPTT